MSRKLTNWLLNNWEVIGTLGAIFAFVFVVGRYYENTDMRLSRIERDMADKSDIARMESKLDAHMANEKQTSHAVYMSQGGK